MTLLKQKNLGWFFLLCYWVSALVPAVAFSSSAIRLPSLQQEEPSLSEYFSAELVDPVFQEVLAPDGASEADAYARQIYQMVLNNVASQDQLKNKVIVFLVEAEHVPSELRWVISFLLRQGMAIKILRVHPNSVQQNTPKRQEMLREALASQLILKLHHTDDPELAKLVDDGKLTPGFIRKWVGNVLTTLKFHFGLHNGISWAMYTDGITGMGRPVSQQLRDTAGGLLLGSMIYGFLHYQLSVLAQENPAVNVTIGSLSALGFQIFHGFFARANSSFTVQGKHYMHDRKTIDTSRLWFYFARFSHSSITALGIQLGTLGLGAFAPEVLTHTAWNSALGIFASALPALWIARHQQSGGLMDSGSRRHGHWKTFFISMGVAGGLSILKFSHLFHGVDVLSGSYVALAVSGLMYEAYHHYFGAFWPATWKERFLRALHVIGKDIKAATAMLGLRRPELHQTRILMRERREHERVLTSSPQQPGTPPDGTCKVALAALQQHS